MSRWSPACLAIPRWCGSTTPWPSSPNRHLWRAKQALAQLQPEWDVGAAGSVDSAQLSKEYRAALGGAMLTARNEGNVDKAISGGGQDVRGRL